MKKRIYLLITLILSLFIFSGRVEAAKKMYCIYESKGLSVSTMIVQDSSGTISMYFHKKTGTFASNDEGWYQYTGYDIVFESDYYNDEKKELSKCPNYHSIRTLKNEAVFHNEKLAGQENRLLIDYPKEGEDVNINAALIFKNPSNYKEQINNTKWLGKCVYGLNENSKLELYFNDDTYIIANYFSNFTTGRFSKDELLKVVRDSKTCPPYLYMYTASNANSRTDEIHLYAKDLLGSVTGVVGGTTFSKTDLPFLEGKVDIDFGVQNEPSDEPINDCTDLFGADLVKQINKVMDIVKIAVPILLIGFGIFDFTNAIFAGNEDNMGKSKKTFFKRIIAAVLVFIAPIFVNLILSLANEVWGYISPDTCIEQSE